MPAEEKERQLLEQGRYRAKALDAVLGVAGTGNEEVAVLFELLDSDARGQTLAWYGFFSDDSYEWTVKALCACGWDNDDLTKLMPSVTDNEVELVVTVEPAQGDRPARNRVRFVNPVSSATMLIKTKLDAAEAAAFAQQMKGRVLQIKAKMKQGEPSNTGSGRTAAPAPADDDTPF